MIAPTIVRMGIYVNCLSMWADIPLPQNKKKKQKDKIQEAEKNEQDKNKICT